jgi:hypothetical protein
LEKKAGISASLFTIGNTLTFNRVLRRILVNQILVYMKSSLILIFQSSNIRNFEGVTILFCLEKKTSVSASIFTIGHKITFDCVMHPILVNQILEYRKAVKFLSFSFPILETLRAL